MSDHRNPVPTVDVVVELEGERIVLIQRKNEPLGWALPGGFVDEGETLEEAARREMREEIGLDVTLHELLGAYSEPTRDPRRHTISIVYVGHAPHGAEPRAGDDARGVGVFTREQVPSAALAFDHGRILKDYWRWRETGSRPALGSPAQESS